MEKSQKALEDLEGFAKATGQAINPKKSFWWLMYFQWKGGKWSIPKGGEFEPELYTKDKNGVEAKLERVECTEAKEILGTWACPRP